MFAKIIFAIVLIGGLLLFGFMHEQVHVAVYKSYGIESEVHYLKNFPDFTTTVSYNDYVEKCTDNCKLANNINEAVSYPLMAFYFVFSIGIFIIIGFLEELSKIEVE